MFYHQRFSVGSVDVRLVGGELPNVGRVEVYFNNQWGTVCQYGWSHEDAQVICRQLGYPEGNHQAVRYNPFGEGTGPIWLDDVFCTGTENNIMECSHYGWGNTEHCDHLQDAGVICLLDGK